MGNGDVDSLRDLFFEERDNAALRAVDVAEAYGFDLRGGTIESQSGQIGDSFGSAHDAGGVGGFICGDEDELLAAVTNSGLREGKGSDRIVFERRERMQLHERDMLERGGMKDDVRMVEFENLFERSYVADVREDGRVGRRELTVDAIKSLFGGFKQQNVPGMMGGDRMSEGRPDGASRAGDKDGFAGNSVHRDWERFGRKGRAEALMEQVHCFDCSQSLLFPFKLPSLLLSPSRLK